MLSKKQLSVCFLVALLPGLCMANNKSQGVVYYRYTDHKGELVISRQGVPNDLIGNGYEVLNESGRVVRKVARAPNAQELRLKREQEQQEREDKRLQRLYTIVEDVDRARDSKLAEVDTLINVFQTDLFELGAKRSDLLGKAANMERTGRQVPQDILDSIAGIEQQENGVRDKIAAAEQNKDEIRQKYSVEKQRLQFLLQNK